MGYEILNPMPMPAHFPTEGEFLIGRGDNKVWFHYARIETLDEATRDWAVAQGASHWVIPMSHQPGDYSRMRGAKVLKTRVHWMVDENEFGNAVWATEDIHHNTFFVRN